MALTFGEFPLEEYRRTIGAVFQDYCLFSATVAENVLADLDEGRQDQEILDALRDAGFEQRLSKMEQGIHTMLGREFDPQGVNLSGGEEQKIAISRIFVRQHPILILDEPSSSLDPISEYELNHTIANTVGQQAVLFHIPPPVHHKDGGSHLYAGAGIGGGGRHPRELMAMDGRYAYMFRIQAERYQETAPAG
ncbi:MAG: ATP-binding cassette domain-containing protein [Clostridia bacterium]